MDHSLRDAGLEFANLGLPDAIRTPEPSKP